MNLFPREHSIHQFQALLGGGLALFRRQGPPGLACTGSSPPKGARMVGHIDLSATWI